EWRAVSGRRQPFHQRRADRAPFAMAGLYDCWRPAEGEPVASCTIVTTEANALLAPLHDRMPVILEPEAWDAWLDPESRDTDALSALLRPAPVEGWVSYAVDTRMNRARHDEASNVEPIFDEGPPAG
ncbi:MAG TPA: SOS response-associated peptidase, partial [Myxococcota bacterium]|nr:SOS response-associated peptidase [Myxococcota bacterium]